MNRRVLGAVLGCIVGVCAQVQAHAQSAAPRTYAVMSLVGDSLSLVSYGGAGVAPGTKVGQKGNFHNDVQGTAFDATALNAIALQVRKLKPDAAQELLSTRNATLFRMQDRIFDAGDAAKGIRNSLQALLVEHNASHLIVVTKHRDEVEIPLASGAVGGGTLEGLGFYVDNSVSLTNPATGKAGFGVIGAYICVTLRLVDAKTMRVIRELPIANYRALPRTSSRAEEQTWDKLTDAQKVGFVQGLIRETVDTEIPRLLNNAR